MLCFNKYLKVFGFFCEINDLFSIVSKFNVYIFYLIIDYCYILDREGKYYFIGLKYNEESVSYLIYMVFCYSSDDVY